GYYETVKAAQENWPVPVFTDKWETDANYEQLTRFLLENHTLLRPAFGSHNIRSLAHALACAQMMDLPPGSFELQMLYGMAESVKEALVGLGQRVRIYTPYGELLPGMAYLVRRLLENTANESFLRASFTEHVPEEQLLMNPQQLSIVRGSWSAAKENQTTDNGQRADMFQNEPLSDFSKEEARWAMKSALETVRGKFGQTYPLVIGGSTVPTPETIDSVNPSHQKEIVGRCGRATATQAQEAIAAAGKAFPAWRDTDPEARADYLVRAADIMRRRRFELAAWQVFECGKQW